MSDRERTDAVDFDFSLPAIPLTPAHARHLVGLDIGSHSIKLAELKPGRNGWTLIGLNRVNLSPEVIVEGVIINEAAVIEAINTLFEGAKTRTKQVAISLGGNAVIVKRVTMPRMSFEDLERNIEVEAAEHIPFPMDEVNVDFEIMGDDPDEPDRMIVYLVAAKKDMINELTGVLLSCGLKAAVLDVDVFTVGNVFEVNYPELLQEPVALVNIGASVTNINLVRDGKSLFVRDITRGGYEITEEIQRALGVSFDEAEMFKRGGGDDQADSLIPEEVGEILRNSSIQLARDIQRSLDYFAQTGGTERVSRLFISGGMSLVNGMDRIIEEETGIAVEILNPFRKIAIDEKRVDPMVVEREGAMYAVSVGLGIRRAFDK
ncbi:MAG: type IV pilus assembly protein PilM [Candidatus Dadabacteria bacterium]|nr:MAG: type IV pilus assembly protein PilM [Candidatus Dadabacteria bacterium]